MKILFAVSNDNITTSVVNKYQQKYKEIVTSKNVYYFNAIIKELQRDKSYDAIVIGEDLEPISNNNNYDTVDKFLFEKLDGISDEASKTSGEDIPIIFICSDRRVQSDQLLIKLFGIGIYNAIIGNDRSIDTVCNLINKPRNKKEAKLYYKVEAEEVGLYERGDDQDVSESEIQNILAHYRKIGTNEKKCVESFDSIADQYNETQLRIIIKFLPNDVKSILEANSTRYQNLVSKGTVLSDGTYQQYQKQNPKKPGQLDVLTKDIGKATLSKPVIIPSTININKMANQNMNARQPQTVNQMPNTFNGNMVQNPRSAMQNGQVNQMQGMQNPMYGAQNQIPGAQNPMPGVQNQMPGAQNTMGGMQNQNNINNNQMTNQTSQVPTIMPNVQMQPKQPANIVGPINNETPMNKAPFESNNNMQNVQKDAQSNNTIIQGVNEDMQPMDNNQNNMNVENNMVNVEQKRGRGRPRKVANTPISSIPTANINTNVNANTNLENSNPLESLPVIEPMQPRRGRGRPRKIINSSIPTDNTQINPMAQPAPVMPESVVSEPVQPAPVMPAPIVSEPVQPAPIMPEPIINEPVQPAPVTPEPIVSEPVQPAPVMSAPIVSEPVQQAPVMSAPIVSEPVQPAPVMPEPIISEPVQPAPVMPEPIVSEPVQQAPVMPEPIISEPVQPAPTMSTPTEPANMAENNDEDTLPGLEDLLLDDESDKNNDVDLFSMDTVEDTTNKPDDAILPGFDNDIESLNQNDENNDNNLFDLDIENDSNNDDLDDLDSLLGVNDLNENDINSNPYDNNLNTTSDTMNTPKEAEIPNNMNALNNVNIPQKPEMPNNTNVASTQNDMNNPYGMGMQNDMNNPYGASAPNDMNNPYGASTPNDMNNPYGASAQNDMNNPYGVSTPNDMSNPYGMGMPNDMNNPYGANTPNDMSNPYGASTPNDMNNPYGMGMPNDMNNPYGMSTPNDMSNPYDMNTPNNLNNQNSMDSQSMDNNLFDLDSSSTDNNLFELDTPSTDNNLFGLDTPNTDNNLFGLDTPNDNNNPFESNNQNDVYGNNSFAQPENNLVNTATSNEPMQTNVIAGNGKIVAFVGTTKNGTSFIVNNLAQLLSQNGVKTAVLDLTKNKNSYYMFTDNDANLMKKATDSIKNLSNGVVDGLEVNKNLTIFTSLPEESDEDNKELILQTLSNNFEVALLDCDFNTAHEFFINAHEIYLVQSMDTFTIQPLTQFLSDLKLKNILDESKLRVIINKHMKLKKLDERLIIGGMSKYNEPSMTLQRDLFNATAIKHVTIPFSMETYSKYLESIAMCNLNLNGYPQEFLIALEQLKNMVFPLIPGGNNRQNQQNNLDDKHGKFSGKKGKQSTPQTTQFSNDVNDTLNRMRTNNF